MGRSVNNTDIKRPSGAQLRRRRRRRAIRASLILFVTSVALLSVMLYRRHLDYERFVVERNRVNDSIQKVRDSEQAAMDSTLAASISYFHKDEIDKIIRLNIPSYSPVNLWVGDSAFLTKYNNWVAEYFTEEDGRKHYHIGEFDQTGGGYMSSVEVKPAGVKPKGVLRSYVAVDDPSKVFNIREGSIEMSEAGEIKRVWYFTRLYNKVEATADLPSVAKRKAAAVKSSDDYGDYYDEEDDEDNYDENMEDWYFYHNRK